MDDPSPIEGGAPSAVRTALIARALIAPRDASSHLSPGAVAGAVVGSVVGAIIVAFCAYPFIVRYLRKRRGDYPFDPEAEIQAAQQAMASASNTPQTTDSPMTKRLSVDRSTPPGHVPASDGARVASRLKHRMAAAHGSPGPGSPQAGQTAASALTPPAEPQPISTFDTVASPQRAPTNQTMTTVATHLTTPPPEKQRRSESTTSTWSALSKAMRSTTSVFRRTSSRSIPTHYTPHDPQQSWIQSQMSQPMYQEPVSMSSVAADLPTSGAAAAYYFPNGTPTTHTAAHMPPNNNPSTAMGASPDFQNISAFSNGASTTPAHSPSMMHRNFNGSPMAGSQMISGLSSMDAGDNYTFVQDDDRFGMPVAVPTMAGTVNPQDLSAANGGLDPAWQQDLEDVFKYNQNLGTNMQAQQVFGPPPTQSQNNQEQQQEAAFSGLPTNGYPITGISMSEPNANFDPTDNDLSPTALEGFFQGVPGYNSGSIKTETTAHSQAQPIQYAGTAAAAAPTPASGTNGHGYPPQQSSPLPPQPHTPMFIKSEPDVGDNMIYPDMSAYGTGNGNSGHKRDYSHSSMSVGLASNFVDTPNTQITGASSSYGGSLSPCPMPQHVFDAPKPFKCPECGREFEEKHKLNHHTRYHDRKYHCKYPNCTANFGTKTHLDRHVNDKHTKTRGFHCTVEGCAYSLIGGKSFPRKDNWRRHMQNKHKLSPDQDPISVELPSRDQDMADLEEMGHEQT